MFHRIGVIGAGDVVSRAYLPAITKRADCMVMAVCSESGRSARELAAHDHIPMVCNDYVELLDCHAIETVFVCTPTHLHREMAAAAMSRRKNVLVEKPICTTYADARYLLQQAKEYSKTFYAAYKNQFREENLWLKSKALSGELGRIEIMDFEWYRTKRYEHKTWLYDPVYSGGGVLMDLGAHLIHIALSLLPSRCTYRAFCQNILRGSASSRVEDTSVALVTVNDRTAISIKLGWDMKLQTKSKVVLQVYGTAGHASNLDYNGPKRDGYEAMVADFLGQIEGGATYGLGLVEDSMLLLDALYRSNESRETISGQFVGVV